MEEKELLTTSIVAKMCGCCISAAQKWAKTHGLKSISANKRLVTYLWGEEDIAAFKARDKPGGWRPSRNKTADK